MTYRIFYLFLAGLLGLLNLNVFGQGATMGNPIIVNSLNSGYYSDARSTVGYGNDYTGQPSEDVFYRFTLPAARTVTVSLCGSQFDTYLHVLNSAGTELAYNDDNGPSCAGLQSSLSYTFPAGTYYIVVEGYAGTSGNYNLAVSCAPFQAVTGADIYNPIDMGTLNPGSTFTDTQNNSPANGFGNDIGQPSDDVFYKFTLTGTDSVNISTCSSALADTYLHLLNAAGTEIYSNDDNGPLCAGLHASLKVQLAAGTYYIATEGWNNNYGNITLDVGVPGNGPNVLNAFTQQMANTIAHLETNRVPYGLLRDVSFEYVNLDNYNGQLLADSTMISPGIFNAIYSTLSLAKVNSANAPAYISTDTLAARAMALRQPGRLVLEGLYYEYAQTKPDAVPNNQLSVVNNQVYDVYQNGIWQNPYDVKTAFAASVTAGAAEGLSQQILLPSSLWLTNNGAAVASIQLDAGDGQGFRNVALNTPVSVMYPDTGLKTLTLKLTLTDNRVLQARPIRENIVYPPDGCGNCQTFFVAGPGNDGGARVTIHYGHQYGGMLKPFIVAEGFDPGSLIGPELRYGATNYSTFKADIARSRAQNAPYTLSNLENLLLNDYDLVYVDWADGTADVTHNAAVLENVIREINSRKAQAGSTQPNVVMGISMGGLVARWALKDMENNSENHQTRLYISYDSPQQGANVPLGALYAAQDFQNTYLRAPAGGLNELFKISPGLNSDIAATKLTNSMAAKQMLINRVDRFLHLDNSVHNSWQNSLRSMGYPNGVPGIPFNKIAVSDGAACGDQQPIAPGDQLLNINGNLGTLAYGDLVGMVAAPLVFAATAMPQTLLGILPGNNKVNVYVNLNATANGGGNEVYRNHITYTKKIFWLINVTLDLTSVTKYAPQNALPFDSYAGGQYDVKLASQNLHDGDPSWGYYNIHVSSVPLFDFVPVTSALDIGSGNTALSDADYRTAYNGLAPPASPKNTPFDAFLTNYEANPINSRSISHTAINSRNGDWLYNEISNGSNTPCASLCSANYSINGPSQMCFTETYNIANLPAGASVVWSIPEGGATATLGSNNTAIVNTGNPHGQQVILTATISNNCGNQAVVTLPITLGIAPPVIQGLNEICINDNSNGEFFTNPAIEGATAYNWSIYPSGNLSTHGRFGSVMVNVSQPGTYTLHVEVETPCYTLLVQDFDFTAVDCDGGGEYNRYQAYPNPAGQSITITSKASQQSLSATEIKSITAQKEKTSILTASPFRYKVIDSKGKVCLQGNSEKGEDLNANVSGLPNGIYYIHFTAGKKLVRRQIIIQH